jgi:hypothetical protein
VSVKRYQQVQLEVVSLYFSYLFLCKINAEFWIAFLHGKETLILFIQNKKKKKCDVFS